METRRRRRRRGVVRARDIRPAYCDAYSRARRRGDVFTLVFDPPEINGGIDCGFLCPATDGPPVPSCVDDQDEDEPEDQSEDQDADADEPEDQDEHED